MREINSQHTAPIKQEEPQALSKSSPVVGIGASTGGLNAFTCQDHAVGQGQRRPVCSTQLRLCNADQSQSGIVARRAVPDAAPGGYQIIKTIREIKVWLTTSLLLDGSGKPHAIAITEREIT